MDDIPVNSVWCHADELLDGTVAQCLLHGNEDQDHAACTANPLAHDTPRSIHFPTGMLSLHEYRKSQAQARVDDPGDRDARSLRSLKRKTGAVHLNRSARPSISSSSYPVSVSSATSTPPLSPSYSHSVISRWSLDSEVETSSVTTGPRATLVSDHGHHPRPNRKRLNTFREKLQKSELPPSARPSSSDPMLATSSAVATVSHGGACFEILNPRKSLDLARIVSFIDDVDTCSVLSDPRDSRMSTEGPFYIEQGLDRASLSQFTDASLPSHCSTPSLYTSLPAREFTPKRLQTDLPSSSPGVPVDRVRSFSEYSLREHQAWTSPQPPTTPTTPSTLKTESPEPQSWNDLKAQTSRPDSDSQGTFFSDDSDIGEPGSPVYANGEWAQVDERDRGIVCHLPDLLEPADPVEPLTPTTPTTPPPSASYLPYSYDPFDPVYLDPHVQSVLAAANAETMGLRGHPVRALDDLHRRNGGARRYHSSGKEDRKLSFVQRRGIRKLFSWRSGS